MGVDAGPYTALRRTVRSPGHVFLDRTLHTRQRVVSPLTKRTSSRRLASSYNVKLTDETIQRDQLQLVPPYPLVLTVYSIVSTSSWKPFPNVAHGARQYTLSFLSQDQRVDECKETLAVFRVPSGMCPCFCVANAPH